MHVDTRLRTCPIPYFCGMVRHALVPSIFTSTLNSLYPSFVIFFLCFSRLTVNSIENANADTFSIVLEIIDLLGNNGEKIFHPNA